MVLQLELAAMITVVLTIFATVVGLTRYITQLQLKLHQERLELEKEAAEKRLLDVEARYRELANDVAAARKLGTAALVMKAEVETDLASIMRVLHADAGSIYIPLGERGSQALAGLVFLCILPLNDKTKALRKKIIPLQSLAGRCFTTRVPFVVTDPKKETSHFHGADRVSGFKTEDALNIPLLYQGEPVGVLQLLNKERTDYFREEDIPIVEPFAASLAVKVAEFLQAPNSLEILGVTSERNDQIASVMFCDMTRSAVLFQEMNAVAAVQHLNEYLEMICDTAFEHGATVDSYIGDGVLFRFNVPRPLKDHPLRAAEAALGMRESFDRLKNDWLAMGEILNTLFIRIAIAYGPVNQAIIGHPQYQRLSIFGQPVSVAANLCEAARRDKHVIVIDEALHKELNNKFLVSQLPIDRLGKASNFIRCAYELEKPILDK